MRFRVILWVAGVAGVLLLGSAAPAGAAPRPSADCVAQFIADFQALNPGFTIGQVQGQLGVEFPNYPFGPGGQAHYLQPFGVILQEQATAAHNACPFDLTP